MHSKIMSIYFCMSEETIVYWSSLKSDCRMISSAALPQMKASNTSTDLLHLISKTSSLLDESRTDHLFQLELLIFHMIRSFAFHHDMQDVIIANSRTKRMKRHRFRETTKIKIQFFFYLLMFLFKKSIAPRLSLLTPLV